MYRINFYLTEPQLAKLRKLAADTRLSLAEHLRRAIDAYLRGVDKVKG